MELLNPDWNQPKPAPPEVQAMCQRLQLKPAALPTEPFDKLSIQLRARHERGGAHLVVFDVGPDPIFDWFAARNRLWEADILDTLLVHPTIRAALPELKIPSEPQVNSGFGIQDPFLFDGHLANMLHNGGAYKNPEGDGRIERLSAIEVSDAMFGLRCSEINLCLSYDRWTPWFLGSGWDFTAVIFDRRLRRLWILAVTDSD